MCYFKLILHDLILLYIIFLKVYNFAGIFNKEVGCFCFFFVVVVVVVVVFSVSLKFSANICFA